MSWECRFGFRPRDSRHGPTFCELARQSIPEPSNEIVPAFRICWPWVPLFSSRPGMLSPVKFLFLRAPAFAQSSKLAITVLLSNVSLCPATYQAGYLSALAAPVDRLITSDARERTTGVELAVCRHLFSRLEYGIMLEVAKYDPLRCIIGAGEIAMPPPSGGITRLTASNRPSLN
jgi:hypothetical protein